MPADGDGGFLPFRGRRMCIARLAADCANLRQVMDRIPPEIVFLYARQNADPNRGRDPER